MFGIYRPTLHNDAYVLYCMHHMATLSFRQLKRVEARHMVLWLQKELVKSIPDRS